MRWPDTTARSTLIAQTIIIIDIAMHVVDSCVVAREYVAILIFTAAESLYTILIGALAYRVIDHMRKGQIITCWINEINGMRSVLACAPAEMARIRSVRSIRGRGLYKRLRPSAI